MNDHRPMLKMAEEIDALGREIRFWRGVAWIALILALTWLIIVLSCPRCSPVDQTPAESGILFEGDAGNGQTLAGSVSGGSAGRKGGAA